MEAQSRVSAVSRGAARDIDHNEHEASSLIWTAGRRNERHDQETHRTTGRCSYECRLSS